MDDPLVSVYLPTHGRPEMLQRAMRSVWEQDYPHVELVICDDGSDERSLAQARALAESRGAVWLRNEQPEGACSARNRAIEAARGELITGLDDDDEFESWRIRRLVDQYDGSMSFVAHGYLEVGAERVCRRVYDSGSISFDSLLHYNRVGNQVLTETERLRSVGMFDTRFPAMQDYEAWLRLTRAFGPAMKYPECSYRLHVAHEVERISRNPDRLEKAYAILQDTYRECLKQCHRNSHHLLLARTRGEHLPLREIFRCGNRYNVRLALSILRRQWRMHPAQ